MWGAWGRKQVSSRARSTVVDKDRPSNRLLQVLSPSDFKLIAPHLDEMTLPDDRVLSNSGDPVEFVYFPCDGALLSFVVALHDGREVQTLLVGSEGAAGGIVGLGHLPAFSRIVVRYAGVFLRLPVAKLEGARRKSVTFSNILSQYADYVLGQAFQAVACNAAHSIEQRAAKWIIAIMDRTERDLVPLTHDKLATMLGVGRSYTSRVIQSFKGANILETRRGSFLVRNRTALQTKSCQCDDAVAQHFSDVIKQS